MGLLAWRSFSSIPDFQTRRSLRQKQQEGKDTEVERDKNDFIQDRGTFRSGSNFVTNGTTTLFTVEDGTVFYLIAAVIHVAVDAVNVDSNAFMLVKGLNILRARSEGITDFTADLPLNFSIPIKMIAGERIQISSGNANLVVTGSFTGYELTELQDKEVSIERL